MLTYVLTYFNTILTRFKSINDYEPTTSQGNSRVKLMSTPNIQTDAKVYNVTLNDVRKYDNTTVFANKLDTQRHNFVPLIVTGKPCYITTKNLKKDEAFKRLAEYCKVESHINMGKDSEIKYSTGKMRIAIGKLFFQTDMLSDDRWTYIRKLSKCLMEFHKSNKFHTTYRFKVVPEKIKVYDSEQFAAVWFTAVYLKLKHPTKFPRLNQKTLEKVALFVADELEQVTHLTVYHPLDDSEKFLDEVNLMCPWFDDCPRSKDTEALVSYKLLQSLLAKSFYGYAPSPQYIGKLGYDCPQTRTYSLSDFKLIRSAIIESNRRRNKPDNFIIIESL